MSNELAQVRRARMITIKDILKSGSFRIDSTIDVGNVMAALGPAMGSLTNLRLGLSGVMPEVDTRRRNQWSFH